jgi:hypothetical protein
MFKKHRIEIDTFILLLTIYHILYDFVFRHCFIISKVIIFSAIYYFLNILEKIQNISKLSKIKKK